MKPKVVSAKMAAKNLKSYLAPFTPGNNLLMIHDLILDIVIQKETGWKKWYWDFTEEQLKRAIQKEFPSATIYEVIEGMAETSSYYITMLV